VSAVIDTVEFIEIIVQYEIGARYAHILSIWETELVALGHADTLIG
jgi:hypothetical protein